MYRSYDSGYCTKIIIDSYGRRYIDRFDRYQILSVVQNLPNTAQKVLGQLCPPLVRSLWAMIFNEAQTVNPPISTIDMNIVLKGMTCIVNSNSLQWVWKYLIMHIHSK